MSTWTPCGVFLRIRLRALQDFWVACGNWALAGGTIAGGTISIAAGTVLLATNQSSTLDGVTLAGTLDLATAPIENFITEFLPDIASRIHVRIVLVQQIINQVARTSGTTQ